MQSIKKMEMMAQGKTQFLNYDRYRDEALLLNYFSAFFSNFLHFASTSVYTESQLKQKGEKTALLLKPKLPISKDRFSMGNFFHAFAQADPFGKLIFLGLFFLSITCWSFLLYKLWMISRVKKQATNFYQQLKKNTDSLLSLDVALPQTSSLFPFPYPYVNLYHLAKKKTKELLDKNNYFFSLNPQTSQLTQKNYLSHADIDMLESHLDTAMTKQRQQLESNLFILSTTEKLAPFLGLLGTVWGILLSFQNLQLGQSANTNSAILGGLSTALTTTVLGLLIAIPALIAFTWIQNLTRRFAIDMSDFCHFLLSTIELQYRKVDIES